MMAGPEPDMRAGATYLKLLAEAKKFKLDGKTLTLCDANGNESLIYTATTAASPGDVRPLRGVPAGRRWGKLRA